MALPVCAADLQVADAERFAKLALDCVHREYPNKIAHVMTADEDALPPRQLTPAFYGCYDWHSAVHGHWLLARLTRIFPDAPFAAKARAALDRSLTFENIRKEVSYMTGPGRASFERPYGLAWLLQLGLELREWKDPDAERWSEILRPLESAAVERVKGWLPKLSHPVRSGEHSQSAFALGLMLDWARQSDAGFELMLTSRIRSFYLNDVRCPTAYEPSGEDFVSPCLAEADVLRRVLEPADFVAWFDRFLPEIQLSPAVTGDSSDGKLVHLDGLNLSRAWMLEGIASALPPRHARLSQIRELAKAHREAGLQAVTNQHYEGGHWLGSFAVYLVSGRGLPNSR